MKKEKEILLFDWDDVLFPGLLRQAAGRLWQGPGVDRIADYSLPSEWDYIAEHFWGDPNGARALAAEEDGLLRQFLPVLPDSRETLDELSGRWRLLSAGSAKEETTGLAIRLAGWADIFESTVSGSDLQRGKPHPEIYLRALDRVGAEEEDAYIVVGSRRGAEAAHRSGADYLLLANGEMVLLDPLAQAAKCIFWNLRDLLRWL